MGDNLLLIIIIFILVVVFYTWIQNDNNTEKFNLSNKKVKFKNDISEIPDYNKYFYKKSEINIDDYFDLNKIVIQKKNDEYTQPLISETLKKEYFANLKKGNNKYVDAVSDFREHQLDQSNIIRPDIIDPFQNPEEFKGKPIRQIFDQMTQNISAVPKQIISKKNNMILYDGDAPFHDNFANPNYGDAF